MKAKGWLGGYLFITILHLVSIVAGVEWLRFITKPLLMVFLLVFFLSATKRASRIRHWVSMALFFSWLGDIFLMVEGMDSFMAGLASFLLAHACYIVYFLQARKKDTIPRPWNGIAFAILIAYVGLFYYYLSPSLASGLQVPVLLYAIVIAGMFLAAFHSHRGQAGWYYACAGGALLFILSDSILALDSFKSPVAYASLLIMLTYTTAQALIAGGAAVWLGTAHKS